MQPTATRISDPKLIANNLTNLKRIIFGDASIDNIIPFIRRSTEMQQIKIYNLQAGIYFNQDIFFLMVLRHSLILIQIGPKGITFICISYSMGNILIWIKCVFFPRNNSYCF